MKKTNKPASSLPHCPSPPYCRAAGKEHHLRFGLHLELSLHRRAVSLGGFLVPAVHHHLRVDARRRERRRERANLAAPRVVGTRRMCRIVKLARVPRRPQRAEWVQRLSNRRRLGVLYAGAAARGGGRVHCAVPSNQRRSASVKTQLL